MGYFNDGTAEELMHPAANRMLIITPTVERAYPDSTWDAAPERFEEMTQHQRARSVIRGGMDSAVRTALLEDDVDTLAELLSRTNKKLDKLLIAATTASISFAVSAVLFALNLVING